MRRFDFKKTYEEIDIAGEVYKIRFDDEKLLEYHEEFDKFYKRTKEIQAVESAELERDKLLDTYEEIQKISKEVLDVILGEGAYEDLFERSGRSTLAMVDVINFVSDVVGDGMANAREGRKADYVRK